MDCSQANEIATDLDENICQHVAIVGIACRFPGANNVDEFWNNIKNGVETIATFTDEELLQAGVSTDLFKNPNYVKRKGILADIELFDNSFFGVNFNDARILDPQHRIFFECVVEALESSGYSPSKYKGSIGVYAGMADSTYLQNNILKNSDIMLTTDKLQRRIATSISTLSTQISYYLNLKGPSININTACSTSLVLVAQAFRALVDYDCDLAIAGAVSIDIPQISGYEPYEGDILSLDGHCRAFDANATGTVFSNGAGVVVLKRLSDAIKDGDTIYACIRGYGLSNDGSDKASFTAASINGQVSCVTSALAFSAVSADTLGYIEAHGTGTALGDPVEVSALTEAFRNFTDRKQFCALGSVKANIGHTDVAAGMAGLIKAALSVKYGVIPPAVNYSAPNPHIDFINSPFYVPTNEIKWEANGELRRAGVSSFGIGGTNAHVILEEYRNNESTLEGKNKYQIICLSAKKNSALKQQKENLVKYLQEIQSNERSNVDLRDIAYTLQAGRADYNYRYFCIASSLSEAESLLKNTRNPSAIDLRYDINSKKKVAFMFPGQGVQYAGMAAELYQTQPIFSHWIDICAAYLPIQTKKVLYATLGQEKSNVDLTQEIHQTRYTQVVLFVIEYSLAQFLIKSGIYPDAMIGHSVGEYVAACIAETIDLDAVLRLLIARANLMHKMSPGAMTAVLLDATTVSNYINEYITIAAVNSPKHCVISGAVDQIEKVENFFLSQHITFKRLCLPHAFHSVLIDDILNDFRDLFNNITLKKPRVPFVSNVTGDWITDEQAIDPNYWCDHLRKTVYFCKGIKALLNSDINTFLEVGPSEALVKFVNEILAGNKNIIIKNVLPAAKDASFESMHLLNVFGTLWIHGFSVQWPTHEADKNKKRIPLPTYPFQRKKCWVTPDSKISVAYGPMPYEKWFYETTWLRKNINDFERSLDYLQIDKFFWLILADEQGVGKCLFSYLSDNTDNVLLVNHGDNFLENNASELVMDFYDKSSYDRIFQKIKMPNKLPLRFIYSAPITTIHSSEIFDIDELDRTKNTCFYGLLFFIQAYLAFFKNDKLDILVVANELCRVVGGESVFPAKNILTGLCKVVPQECYHININTVDIQLDEFFKNPEKLVASILYQFVDPTEDLAASNLVAIRGSYYWEERYRAIHNRSSLTDTLLKAGGIYLVIGGLGGVGLVLSKSMALQVNCKFIFVNRSEFPPENTWDIWLENNSIEDSTSKKIKLLKEINDLGSTTVLFKADLIDYKALSVLVDKIQNEHGKINGVIHSAGIVDSDMLQEKTRDKADKVLDSKVIGTYVLASIFREVELDFFILCSSLSSIVGGLGLVDYSAANACLDAFVQTDFLEKTAFTSVINWNVWKGVGMAVRSGNPKDFQLLDEKNEISPEDGTRIFLDILKNRHKQCIISRFDIHDLLSRTRSKKQFMVSSKETVEREAMELNIEYEAPHTLVEEKLAIIWQNLFCIDRVGVNDSFVELGGHSLLALKLIDDIDSEFGVVLSLGNISGATTIAQLARMIMGTLIEQAPI